MIEMDRELIIEAIKLLLILSNLKSSIKCRKYLNKPCGKCKNKTQRF